MVELRTLAMGDGGLERQEELHSLRGLVSQTQQGEEEGILEVEVWMVEE